MSTLITKILKDKLGSKGTTALEFAILSPVFFLLLMAIIEVSIIMFKYMVAENALRQAARSAIVTEQNPATITTAIQGQTHNMIDFTNAADNCVCLSAYCTMAALNAARGTVSTCGTCRPSVTATTTTPEAVILYELVFRHEFITPVGSLLTLVSGSSSHGWDSGAFDMRASTVVTNEPFPSAVANPCP